MDTKEFHSNKYSSNSSNGWDLEIDLENPKELCKLHNNYCNSVVLKIYLDHKFQWPQEGLNYKSLAYEVVT